MRSLLNQTVIMSLQLYISSSNSSQDFDIFHLKVPSQPSLGANMGPGGWLISKFIESGTKLFIRRATTRFIETYFTPKLLQLSFCTFHNIATLIKLFVKEK